MCLLTKLTITITLLGLAVVKVISTTTTPENLHLQNNKTLEKTDIINYVAPGEALELFDDSKITLIHIYYYHGNFGETRKQNTDILAETELLLTQLAYQPNVVYAGNLGLIEGGLNGPGIKNRANTIYATAREASNSLSRISQLLTHLDKYFLGQGVPNNPPTCELQIPRLNFTQDMQKLKSTLQGEVI